MDMIYAVNKNELGINDILQLMIFLVGESMTRLILLYNSFSELILISFIYIIMALYCITEITCKIFRTLWSRLPLAYAVRGCPSGVT